MIPLQAVTPEALAAALPILTLSEARKIVSAVHRDVTLLAPLKEVRRDSMRAIREVGVVPQVKVAGVERSANDPFVKLLIELTDGNRVETVRIPLERPGRYSVCVSSQVGCALACSFCATGRLGLTRNLETWEIVEQVRAVRATLLRDNEESGGVKKGRVHGVVFQGMGEPLSNLDRVLESIAVFSEPSALAIDARCMTVCTSGVPSGIRRLALEAPKVRLGLSLGSAIERARRSLMPIAKAHSLEEVLDAAAFHAETTGLSPMWAVTLLHGVNDSAEHAEALAVRAAEFKARSGVRPRISVIPYNSIGEGDPYARTTDEREALFRSVLTAAGVGAHKRYSGGSDVAAACGQLVAKVSDAPPLSA